MKKKVIAIIMSLAMAVAFMPTFAFADQVDDNAADYNALKAKAIELVAQVNNVIQQYAQAGDRPSDG